MPPPRSIEADLDHMLASASRAIPDEDTRLRLRAIGLMVGQYGPGVVEKMITAFYKKQSFSPEELDLIDRLAGVTAAGDDGPPHLYLALRNAQDPASSIAALRQAFGETLSQLPVGEDHPWTPFERQADDEASLRLVLQKMADAHGFKIDLPFWENIFGGVAQDVAPQSPRDILAVDCPRTGLPLVVKPRYLAMQNNYGHPKKIALFQELCRYYGLKTAEEVTVLPTPEIFKAMRMEHLLTGIKNGNTDLSFQKLVMEGAAKDFQTGRGKGLRIAERLPSFISPDPERGRAGLSAAERTTLDHWFPSAIFDDTQTMEIEGETSHGISAFFRETRSFIHLNPEKFQAWYAALPPEQLSTTQASIRALYDMVHDGILFDLYGGDFGFPDGVFTLIDVEPLQLSNLPNGPLTISYSQNIMNCLFRTVGLPQIDYGEIVRRIYGHAAYLALGESQSAFFDPELSHRPQPALEFWGTNVTNAEELAHYEELFAARKSSSSLDPRSHIPEEIIAQHDALLAMHAAFFDGIRYDWSPLIGKDPHAVARRIMGG